MSLIKQLWIAILFIITVNGLISFYILFNSTKETIREQLYLKNLDNANSLALILTQSEKSIPQIELVLSANFDTGHYKRIHLTDNQGNVIQNFQHDSDQLEVPEWFRNFLEFNVPAGISQVNSGWSLYGTIHVESQDSYAIEMMWNKFKEFLISLFSLAFTIIILGTILLKYILRPLTNIVSQAQSFSNRSFITIQRPWTVEFALVVDAMNTLATRFKNITIENNKRLEDARYRSQHDQVTGLPNISAFFFLLESQLCYRDKDGDNVVVTHSLQAMNGDIQSLHAKNFNEIIKIFASFIVTFYKKNQNLYTDVRLARINETDIAVILTDCRVIEQFKSFFTENLVFLYSELNAFGEFKIASSSVYINQTETSYELLERLDDLLYISQNENISSPFNSEDFPKNKPFISSSEEWSKIYEEFKSISTISFTPVYSPSNQVIQKQAFISSNDSNSSLNISMLVESARRFSRITEIDYLLLENALTSLQQEQDLIVSVLLFQESFLDDKSKGNIKSLLSENLAVCPRLSIEFRESNVTEHHREFYKFIREFKPFGLKFGLKRVGESFSQVSDVHEFGLDYIKIDSAYVFDIGNNQTNLIYLRGLADLAHSLGMSIMADGVRSENDACILIDIGFDGIAKL